MLALAAGAALSLVSVAVATPQESVTFNAVDSMNILNDGENLTMNATFVGGYSVGKLRITGTLNSVLPGTYASEARILATGPDGNTVTVQCFTTATFTSITATDYVASAVVPIGDAAGNWTFQFYESFNDGAGADAQWSDITITLDDEVPTPPPDYTTAEDLGTLSPGDTVSVTSNPSNTGGVRKWYSFTLPDAIPSGDSRYLDIDTNGSTVGAGTDTEIGLFDAAGTMLASDDDDGAGLQSLLSFGAGVRAGGRAGQDGSLSGGLHYLCIVGYNATFSDGWSVTTTNTATDGVFNLNMQTGYSVPPTAPTATDLGDLHAPGGLAVNAQAYNPAEIHWFKFNLLEAVDGGNGLFVDVDSEGSLLSGGAFTDDTEIGIFTASGDLVGADDDDGSGFHSQLTFGSGSTTPANGDGALYDGRDGSMAAGTYYLAVAGFNTNFGATFWTVDTTSTHTGSINISIYTNTGAATGCPADFDGDGTVDFFDYDAFVVCFEDPDCTNADFDGDGTVDFFDYDAFVVAFETPCP